MASLLTLAVASIVAKRSSVPRRNADAAYENRNSEGLMWTAFAEKTEEKYYDVFGPSAALAVMFNCI